MSLLNDVSIAVTPNGYKAEKLYAVVPSSGAADMDVTRATDATRVNERGLIESVLSNVPRIDYTGGGCPHILAEPQRTNLFTYSNDYSQFPISNRLFITANNITSPDGTLNASKMQQKDGFTTAPNIAFSNVLSGTYTVSAFAKKGTRSFLAIAFNGTSYFDLQNGTITTTGSGHTASIENLGNDWYRCSIVKTISTTQTAAFYFADTNNTLTTADDEGYMYLYGTQLEVGSYATSYIPTSGSTVTRNQDQFTRNNLASLINSTEGVLFVEMAALSDDNTDKRISISDGTLNNYVLIGFSRFTGNINREIVAGGVIQHSGFGATGVTQTNNNKFALSWGGGAIKFYINGSLINSTTLNTPPTGLNSLKFSAGNNTLTFFGKVKQLQVYKTALTDNQLMQLTSESYESYSAMAAALTYTIQ